MTTKASIKLITEITTVSRDRQLSINKLKPREGMTAAGLISWKEPFPKTTKSSSKTNNREIKMMITSRMMMTMTTMEELTETTMIRMKRLSTSELKKPI